ncbi:adenosylcobinamide-GDP ribazoletransferase [Albimonas sp. CAU 1670]|uniref:adenosylcobinamide-GDP ribazoletransferase n=1 Tax=Albimonas sp. CAU 1670 TaxID=3032599 RepID=UPI0023DB986D|nr:adenosylcobinamide-GDP ribazoletransferase [Albimonas sp. CAU 1670]MDF2233887.1 adenosylcobinamide-GDP ribazoletransferase [Albimonas sp. CAU 1670]
MSHPQDPDPQFAADETARRRGGAAGRAWEEVSLLLYALQFLTRLPVPASAAGHGPDRLARAARWFPLAGALVGGIAGGVFALGALALPPLAAAGMALAVSMALTGALHEDGLSDTLDGLGGGFTRERALEIMRDSRIGAYGAAGLATSLLIRAGALTAFAPAEGLAALVAAHAAGRAAMIPAIRFAAYARAEGAASTVAAGAPAGVFPASVLLAALICALAAGWAGLAALCAAYAAGALVLWRLRRRLGGYTGDGLGAMEQAGEIAALLVLAALLPL